MSNSCKYYKQQRQVSYDQGQTWQNLNEYRKGVLYEVDSQDCQPSNPIYRWQINTATTDYACVGVDKHYKEYYQVSYDNGTTWQNVTPSSSRTSSSVIEYNSTDCGFPFRWIRTNNTLCVAESMAYNKYFVYKKQFTSDGGQTWVDTDPLETTPSGDSIASYSTMSECESATTFGKLNYRFEGGSRGYYHGRVNDSGAFSIHLKKWDENGHLVNDYDIRVSQIMDGVNGTISIPSNTWVINIIPPPYYIFDGSDNFSSTSGMQEWGFNILGFVTQDQKTFLYSIRMSKFTTDPKTTVIFELSV